jgi:hypothetical protein
VKAFGGFIVGLAAVVACIFGVYQVVHPSRTPSFSQSNIGTYANANAFLSFLSGHQGQKVTLNVTCIESTPCSLTDTNPPTLIVFGSAAAANCWNSNLAGSCSDGALITLNPPTWGSNGAGDYFIPQGDYIAQSQGSGGNGVPEGDADYTLNAANS